MSKQTGRRLRPALVAAAVTLAAAGAQAAPPIQVRVNGTPVAFSGTPPTEIKGAVLVPLRGVFEALGASVNYDAAAKTISARKGSASVVLPLGAATATVNRQSQTLSQPAQTLGGTTMVPLRFVAQALGAYVQWDAAASTVLIKTQDPHLASLPAPQGRTVLGQVTGVYTDANPTRITVRVNGRNTAVPYTPATVFLRSAPGQPAVPVTPAEIRAGDQVVVQRDASGTAQNVTAVFGEVRGTLKSLDRSAGGGTKITLNDGTSLELVAGSPITMSGRRLSLSDVTPNEDVVIRTNAANSIGYGMAVVTGNDPTPTPPGETPPEPAPTPPTPAPPAPGTAGPGPTPMGLIGAPSAPGDGEVTINSFTQDAAGPLRAGGIVTATLNGTPGGKATFAIPGVAESVPMRERGPGVYTGTFVVPRNISLVGAAVLGRLAANGATAPLIQASGQITLDSVPPRITNLSPAKDVTVDGGSVPTLSATFSDGVGSGVDPTTTHIVLDGADVTAQATVTPAGFVFTPRAAPSAGAHTVRVSVADRGDNTATAQWAFAVGNQAVIRAFTSSATTGQALDVGATIRFTLTAAAGGRAAVTITGPVKNLPLREASPGTYTGEFTPSRGQTVTGAPVFVRFTPRNGGAVAAWLASGLSIAAGAPEPPRIISPESGADVPPAFNVLGTAIPNATVHVTVAFVSKVLGGILASQGALDSRECQADRNGRWMVEGVPLQTTSLLGNDRDTAFTVSAVALDANGEMSPAASITVRRG